MSESESNNPITDTDRLDFLGRGGWFGYRRWDVVEQGGKQLRWRVELYGGRRGAGAGRDIREAIDAAIADLRERERAVQE